MEHTAGGSKELALSKIVTEAGRMEVLRKAEERGVTAATRANRESLRHTWTTFSRAWGLPPQPLTADKVRAVLASFQAGRHPSSTSRELGDGIRCGRVPHSIRHDFNFESLFHVDKLLNGVDEPRAPMFPVYMLFLKI